MRALVLLLALASCESSPPIKSSAGELIDGVSFEETFPLSNDVKESSLHGERLRTGVAIMDKYGVLALRGDYRASGVLEKSTLTIIVKPVAGAERRVTFRSCADEKVCKFFDEAAAQGVIEHVALVCRNRIPCDPKR